ncbi:MAG: PHB depolymerase family esterase [Chloroflexota bacterium]|nr:PHB depolymerase family esterase [Chloroflexota bacterium]
MNRFRHAARGCTLAFLLLSAQSLFAQETTPELTPEITPEATDTIQPTRTPLDALPGAGNFTVQQPFDGVQRVYRIQIPASYERSDQLFPLVFVLHGAGGDGAGMEVISAFNAISERDGVIVVYPDGIDRVWNDGRPMDSRVDGTINDVAFLAAITQYLEANLRIDPERVYATGYSMGGMLAYRLGCLLPDIFAAVASVASTMPAYILEECIDADPIPVMIVQGTDDTVIPWTGVRGGYLSARDTVRFWRQVNGCVGDSQIDPMDDAAPDDGTRALIEASTDCEQAAEVTLIGVYFGGHTWAGTSVEVSTSLGLTSQDFSATELIWQFFSRHVKIDETAR